MSIETAYKCDLCNDTCTIDILKGIKIGTDTLVFGLAENAKKHICNRCIKNIWEIYTYDGPELEDKEEEG